MDKTEAITQTQPQSSRVQKLRELLAEFVGKIFIKKTYFDDLGDIATIYRLKELDSSWTMINSELKLWRYFAEIPEEEYELDDLSRFRPLLLVHGYQSNHITWNWMVNKLWKDGFRIIFAFELDDYKKGFDHNMNQIIKAVDYIREIEPIFKKIDIIAHSMGGIISKYYIKLFGGATKVRLFVALGAPLTGVYRFWKVLASLDSAEQTAIDFGDTEGVLSQINEAMTDEILYTLTQIHIIGSLRRYLGTDGFFKIKPTHDMVNCIFPVKHTCLNRDERIYKLVRQLLARELWFYKIRLLYIQYGQKEGFDESSIKLISGNQETEHIELKKETKKLIFQFKARERRTERYPRDKDIVVEKGQIYMPTDPIFVYSGMTNLNEKATVTINASIIPDQVNTKEIVNLELSSDISRYVELVTLTLSANTPDEIKIQFAVYMYQLNIFTY